MTATLTLDDAGRLLLPDEALRVLGMKPGARLQADVTPNRIQILEEQLVVNEGVVEDGILLLPRFGLPMDAAAAVRADRDALADRALRK
jgi:bifunctional DNA-binding transcriptional regulator/antitoxin component of YhaV-PrlF toxin-antitoxin module